MRKRRSGRILSRKKGPRKALLISIVRALAHQERVRTTEAKAKEIRPLIERLVTKAKTDNLHVRRELKRYLSTHLVEKMVTEIGPRFRNRQGGYTRIVKAAPRKSDGAKMAVIELLK